jgi:mannose-1-phosphate guanylyltransferase / phosphomannomutase
MPLGTGGILFQAKTILGKDDFILLFGDLMLDIDWERMIAFHKLHHSELTAFAHPNSHPFDSDLLVVDKNDIVTGFDSKHNARAFFYENIVTAGIYILSNRLLDTITASGFLDFETQVMSPAISRGEVYAYRSSEYVKDCGTPDRFATVTEDIKNGVVMAKCLSHKQKCIFLDRDGTLNVFGDFVTNAEKLTLMPDAGDALKMINQSGFLAIVITNQPVVARGETSFDELHRIHNKLEDLLGKEGAYLDDLFFCPHHPDGGYPGEVPELKIVCSCRKPKIGLLLKAQERYNIDFSQSWFVGDTKQDVQTGLNAGCRTVLLTCGDPHPSKLFANAEPTFISNSIKEAIVKILSWK